MKDQTSCEKCIQGLYLEYSNITKAFTGTCKSCVSTGEYIDDNFSSSDGLGVCLTHSECLIQNCKKCSNLLKKCQACEDTYFLNSPDENTYYCSACPPNTFMKNDPTQANPICNPKIIISGNLSATDDPRSFILSFNEAWEEYFINYEANFKIEITGENSTDYNCKSSKNM